MDDQDHEISSEINEEYNYTSTSKPTFNCQYVVSRYTLIYPLDSAVVDSDGDIIVPRKNSKCKNEKFIEIEHKKSTVLDMVGLQVWRGALLLADWLIYRRQNIPNNSFILELGSGVGLTSIVASMFAPVFCTDVNKGDILPLIRNNLDRNKHLVKYPVKVMTLDFMSQELPQEVLDNLSKISIVIAADTVYDDSITEAFVKTVQNILSVPPQRSVYVALEKRYVFTIADCDSVAPCYEYYLRCLYKAKDIVCEEVPLDFPQFFKYNRTKELVLWKLSSSVYK